MNAAGRGEKSETEKSFLNNAIRFQDLGCWLPVNVKLKKIWLSRNWLQNRAAWHKSCKVKFSNDKLERATEKHEKAIDAENSASLEKRPLLR